MKNLSKPTNITDSKTKTIDFRKLNQLFFVSLVGANHKIELKIKEFFEKNNLGEYSDSFFYYEYLLHKPFSRLYKKSPQSDFESYWFLAPFLLRLSNKTNVTFDLNEFKIDKVKKYLDLQEFLSPADRKSILEHIHLANLKEALWMDEVIKFWKDEETLAEMEKCTADENDELFSIKEIKHEDQGYKLIPHKIRVNNQGFFYLTADKYKIEHAREKYVENAIKKLKEIKKGSNSDDILRTKITSVSKFIEHAFRLGYLNSLPSDNELPTLLLPIATKDSFFGEVILCFPGLNSAYSKINKTGSPSFPDFKNNILQKIANELYPYILDYYLPSVMIIHEHFFENNRKNPFKDKVELTYNFGSDKIPLGKNKIIATHDIPWIHKSVIKSGLANHDIPKNKISFIEKNLIQYWDALHKSKDKPLIKDLLVFQRYLIASPFMIDLLYDLIKSANNLIKPKDDKSSLPSALVVGTAGSGKDTIPDLIRAFSHAKNGFYNAEIVKINMAGLKPDIAVGALLSGISLDDFQFKFTGILGQIHKKYAGTGKSIILVLDELNSMHINVQGSLLRFLENSEVIRLGSIVNENKKPVNCLVIGIMNEDPDEISREHAMDFLESGNYLGGFMKDVLYEQFISMRRLRPDLKYRLIRGGNIRLKNLDSRRNDIPILFYIHLEKELASIERLKNYQPVFDMGLVTELLSTSYKWSGNVRQVQAVAKKMIDVVLERDEINEDEKILYLFAEDFKKAVRKTEQLEVVI
jgi:hypothetical protein